jgi:hypothetical protein
MPTVLALWVIATYCYTLFNYFAYIWLTSMGPSCGKSLVLKMISMLGFNSPPPTVDPTPATVFRDIEANSSTLVFDEMENLDPERKGELLSLLNAGFERGGQVPRMVPAQDGWRRQTFEAYCPKAVAGISQIPRVLQTRVLQFEMRRKKKHEVTQPFQPDRLTNWAATVRDNMAIFSLRYATVIAQLYEARDKIVPSGGVDGRPVFDDRLRDILAPIYTIAAVIDHAAGRLIATSEVDSFANLQAGARNSESVGDYAIAAHALFEWAERRQWNDKDKVAVRTDEAMEVFKNAEIAWVTESAKAHSLLRKLGGVNKTVWRNGKAVRAYEFDKTELQDLVERNPIEAPEPSPANTA